jgi:hypothetical protein
LSIAAGSQPRAAALAAALLLRFIGIHNAWDSIAYHIFVDQQYTKE